MIDRRAFLRVLAAVSAGAVLDPERLLWVPGAKTMFMPPLAVINRGNSTRLAPTWTLSVCRGNTLIPFDVFVADFVRVWDRNLSTLRAAGMP